MKMKQIQSGDVFGYLTIIKAGRSDNGVIWLCQCKCGNQCEARSGALNRTKSLGGVSSCGCYHYLKKQNSEGLFRCSKCKDWLPSSCFSTSNQQASGLTCACKKCQQDYRTCNRDYRLQKKREYHHRTKEAFKEKRREYGQRNKNAVNARSAAWRQRNPERRREVANSWVARHKAYGAFRSALRIAAKKQATPAWADPYRISIIYKKAAKYRMEVDHIVPLSSNIVCGLHCEANLQLLVKEENIRKSNRYWVDMP